MSRITHVTMALLFSIAMAAPALAQGAGPTVEIRNFVGTIEWSNGPMLATLTRGDNVSISERDGLTIDGQFNPKRYKCKTRGGEVKIRTKGRKYKKVADYPVLRLQIPADAVLDIDDSVIFASEAVQTGGLALDIGHCSRIVLGDTSGSAQLDVSGASDVAIGKSARLTVEASGASDLTLGDTGALKLDVSGATDVEMGRVSGVSHIEASGASEVTIVSLTAENLSVSGSGASELRIAEGRINGLKVKVSGASDVRLDIDVETADLSASGASDVRIRSVSGGVEQSSSGASTIRIGSR